MSPVRISGTGVESVRETVILTDRAAETGYKALMVRMPPYCKNTLNNGKARNSYFRAVADHAQAPSQAYGCRNFEDYRQRVQVLRS